MPSLRRAFFVNVPRVVIALIKKCLILPKNIIMYTAIKGLYENGVLTLLEPVPNLQKSEVLVTFLNEIKQPHKRTPGSLKKLGELEGKQYNIPDNFNDSLEDLKDYM
jgi:hypothetical protein